jgi:putative flippase GtrA
MEARPPGTASLDGQPSAFDSWRIWLPGFIAQTMRYGAVGVAASLIYTAVTILCREWAGFDPVLASLSGFLVSAPFSYLGHWAITFSRRHRFLQNLKRFAALSVTSFIVAVPGMGLVADILHWSYLIGIAFSCCVAPLINYTILQLWVFSHRRAR